MDSRDRCIQVKGDRLPSSNVVTVYGNDHSPRRSSASSSVEQPGGDAQSGGGPASSVPRYIHGALVRNAQSDSKPQLSSLLTEGSPVRTSHVHPNPNFLHETSFMPKPCYATPRPFLLLPRLSCSRQVRAFSPASVHLPTKIDGNTIRTK